MKKTTIHRKLRIENLEERRLTATLPSAFHATPSGPRNEIALVREISPIEQVSLTRGLADTSGWVKGLTRNHNETLVRARRHSNKGSRS